MWREVLFGFAPEEDTFKITRGFRPPCRGLILFLRGVVQSVNGFAGCCKAVHYVPRADNCLLHIRPVVVRCHGEPHGQTGNRVVDLVFTQTERVGTIDGGKYKAAMQAKRCLDTGTVAFARPGASREWVVGTEYCYRHGLRARTQFGAFS